ncbi:MAG TPA: diadenosine tetraphosphate hydrolase [Deltaproteobacteria bacterium]|nr:MAG: hypothetical protein A2Z79_07875 [Deltaproteobacteria bacterium GWA2_55_82]OGQ65146.1 MAG: hypothetical protein A3I81_07295 [Deltaproteobacteria bacterium RIFCSPLOWO2_02_FULL_55_12]OIJ74728.1 MAG: hypothetical protein A2V21_310915 [Deltaproteobacteria bacterium GWC2_55_46]HBG45651.1 diadenosine tetraphosphate hydrolase [Deltaproteobacteria bacterium]HCY12156.1 diadenosine tetraphosphate hydrolase [Deltaproteobacteria bacterium]
MFTLHQRLKDDTIEIARLKLSVALLMNDSSFPWVILVPMREGVTEIQDLSKEDRAALMEEMTAAAKVIRKVFKTDKINIGALGNIVPQLHIHIIGRSKTDCAWPGPVWGNSHPVQYGQEDMDKNIAILRSALQEELSC